MDVRRFLVAAAFACTAGTLAGTAHGETPFPVPGPECAAAAGTGDVAPQARNCLPFVTPQAFGAVGDGKTDDTRALALALGSGRPVLCNGVFNVTAAIVTRVPLNGTYSIQGGGRHACKIALTTLQARLQVQLAGTDPKGSPLVQTQAQVVLRDLSILPKVPLTRQPTEALAPQHPELNAAITIASDTTGDNASPRVFVQNLTIMSDTNAWAKIGILIDSVRLGTLDNVRCDGAKHYTWDAGSACFYLRGAPENPAADSDIPVSWWLRNFSAYHHEYGIFADGHSEGIIVDGAEIVGTRVCLDATRSLGSTLIQVGHVECNTRDVGFDIKDYPRVQIHDSHIFLSGPHPDDNLIACFRIRTERSSETFAQIHDNLCEGYNRVLGPGNLRYGVIFDTTRSQSTSNALSQIHDNIFSRVDVGIDIGPTVSQLDIGCNQYMPTGPKTPIVAIRNASPETDPANRNYLTCVAKPLPAGESSGR